MRTFTKRRVEELILHKISTAGRALFLMGCAPLLATAGIVASAPLAANASPSIWPASASPKSISDTKTESAINVLISQMTVEQKVGQLIQADISAIKPEDLLRYPLGSILAGGNSGPYGDERAGAAKWSQLVGEFRAVSRKSGAGIPILFGVDAVHGHSNLPGATIFPHNIGLGAANDPEMIERIGVATAEEIAGSGIEWTFAPTLAVPQDVRWGRAYEGYSSNPALVARYAKAFTLGLQGKLIAGKPLAAQHVAATAKHFLADGGTIDGRDQGDARVSEAELIAKHAQGYPAAINAGALTVMASFSSWNGIKNHGNRSLLTDVLKGRLGFNGLVVGDWNGHGQIPGCSATDCPAAVNAGIDLLMAPDSWKGLYDSTLSAARNGKISAARIDDAVRRILRVKFKLGLIGGIEIQRGDIASVGSASHLALAREAVSKSLVLLKNNGGILPIRKGSSVLITGSGADNMAMQAGGWTITWQGTDTTAADFPNGQTIGRAIAETVRSNGGKATLSAEGGFDEKPDVAFVVVGEKPYAEFEGDVPNLAFQPKPQEEALVARLKSLGVRVVVVFLSGRPMFTGKLINQADAFVAAWLPGTQGQGVADVLVASAKGKSMRDFTGRLSFSWPADALSPITKPLFPTGYGLSYSKPVNVGAVNDDPRIDVSGASQAVSYVVRGKIWAPWHLVLDGAVDAKAVDLSAQEDARQFSWKGAGKISIEGAPVNLQSQRDDGAELLIDWRIDQLGSGPVLVSFAGAALDMRETVQAISAGGIVQTRIPLRCFSEAGANVNAVGAPFRIDTAAGLVIAIRNVRIDSANGNTACPRKTGN
jgi:beta-glucosidase